MTPEQIQTNSAGKINLAIEQSTSSYLYHYTSNLGLMGIVKGNCFWVSRADFLNDSLEMSYFKDILQHIINEMEQSFNGFINKNDANGDLLKVILAQLKRALVKYPELYLNYAKQIFILSLSENGDSLTLFSNYSSGDGYNIGLKRDELIRSFDNEGKSIIQVGKINYNREEQENIIINDIIDEYEYLVDILSKRTKPATEDEIRTELQKYFNLINYKFLNYSLYFKHPSFYHEEEYRIVFMIDEEDKDKQIRFRPYNSIIIPYIEVRHSSKLPIEFISIGPKNNLDIAKKGVELFLEYNGYRIEPPSKLNIIKSQIPLRY